MCNCTIYSARFPGLALFALILLVASFSSAHAANDPAADSAIQSILTDGWKVGPVGLKSAQSTYSNLQATSRTNSDVNYSYCLALLKHHQYDDVANLLQQKTKTEPQNLKAWRSLIWIHLLKKEYNASLLFLDKMIKQIPPTELQGDDEEEVLKEIRFLGRLLAFLEGPVMNEVSKPLLKSVKDKLIKRLPGVRATEFETNFQEVTMLYKTSAESGVKEKEKAKQEQELAKIDKQKEIDLRKRQNAIQEQELEEKRTRLSSEWTAQAQTLDLQEAPLTRSITTLEARLAVVRREIRILITELNILSEEIEEEENRRERDQLQRAYARLSRILSEHERDLQLILSEGNRLTFVRTAIRNDRLSGQRKLQRDLGTINDQKNNLARANKRLDIEESRNQRAATGNTAKVRVLSSQITSLRAYADFPLEMERHELLAKLP
ncbi:MAG: hypothetical protein COA78_28750 [Blastopirellula sp.]|nr:MAG: hypothetical protein COA78_28750 [Blastopirellula sp.]